MRQLPLALLLAIVACAFAVSLWLQQLVPDGVFWCGDAGLKALMVQQFAAGELHADLQLEEEPWVHALWADGLYPFEPPFVYTIGERHYIQYPLTFPLLSALPYRWLGFRGLYLIPLLSTWLLWGACALVCRRWNWGIPETSAVVAALALASPLTFYGAVFWEHAPAVALAFVGVMPLLTPDRPAGPAGLLGHGVAFGLAIWLREELCAVLGILAALAVITRSTAWEALFPQPRPAPWFAGAAVAVSALLLTNIVIYGHPLGAHAFAVLRYPQYSRLANVWALWRLLPGMLVAVFPIAILACLAPLVRGRTSVTAAPLLFMLIVCGLTMLAIPIMLPDVRLGGNGGKQWGPRFLLVLVPFLCLLVGQCVRDARLARRKVLRTVLALVLAAAFIPAVRTNLLAARAALATDYGERVLPAIRYVREVPGMAVGVQAQYAAQEMMPALRDHPFFLARADGQIARLADALDRRGEREFVYVGYLPKPPEAVTTEASRIVRFEPIGQRGSYYLALAHW